MKKHFEPETLLRAFPGTLSDNLPELLNDRPLNEYAFYHRLTSRRRQYFFSCCNRFAEVTRGMEEEIYSPYDLLRFKHNDKVDCPFCGREIVQKSMGRMRGRYCGGGYPSLHERRNVCELIPYEGGLLCSVGSVYVDWKRGQGFVGLPGYDLPEPWPEREMYMVERKRYFIAPGTVMCWASEWTEYPNFRWRQLKSCNKRPLPSWSVMNQDPEDGYYSTIGLDAISESELRYCAIEQYCSDGWQEGYYSNCVLGYLITYAKHPQLEMLAKMGFHDVITGALNGEWHKDLLKWNARTPTDFFRMNKADFKAFQEGEGTLEDLPRLRELQSRGIPFRLYFEEKKRFFTVQHFCKDDFTLCIALADRCGVTLHKAVTYAMKHWSVRTWRDYLDAAEQLGYDMENLEVTMPRDLNDRHDEAVALVRHRTDSEYAKAYRKKILPRLEKQYAFRMAGYQIVVPKDDAAIINEGKILCHCVGGYAQRHLLGKVAILFLRSDEAPDVPLVTIEMNGTHLKQIHGYKNERDGAEDPRKVYAAIVEPWLAWVKAGSPRISNGEPMMKRKEKTA